MANKVFKVYIQWKNAYEGYMFYIRNEFLEYIEIDCAFEHEFPKTMAYIVRKHPNAVFLFENKW